jgi:hypothetical protein
LIKYKSKLKISQLDKEEINYYSGIIKGLEICLDIIDYEGDEI